MTCLSELTAQVTTYFRDAIALNPANALDPDESTVPTVALPHAQNMLSFRLAMTMGTPVTPEALALLERAEIWLGWVQRGLISFKPTPSPSTPSYKVRGNP